MNEKQEYYYGGEYVTIYSDVPNNADLVIISNGNDYDRFEVVRKSELQKKEDTYQWKKQLERKAELEELVKKAQADLDGLADKVVDKALIALASRMKFNAFFSKDVNGGTAGWAVMVIKELEDLVKEKAKDVTTKKELPF